MPYLTAALAAALLALFRSRVDVAPRGTCVTAAGRHTQTPTTTTATDVLGSVVLDYVTPRAAAMVGCSDGGQARNGHRMASREFPSVLALAIAAAGRVAKINAEIRNLIQTRAVDNVGWGAYPR